MMVSAQAQRSRQHIEYENTKYGRKNWAPGEKEAIAPVRQRVKVTRRAFVLVILLMAGLACVVFLSAYTAQVRYQINSINKQNAAIQANIEMMRLELEKDRSINRLEEQAITEMGMKYPDSSEIIFLEPSDTIHKKANVASNQSE